MVLQIARLFIWEKMLIPTHTLKGKKIKIPYKDMLGTGELFVVNFQLKQIWLHFWVYLGYVLNNGGNLNISHHIVESIGKNNSVLSFESFKLLLRFDDRHEAEAFFFIILRVLEGWLGLQVI